MTAAQLKASILQLAIEGKLIEQDPADEPVSVTPFDGEVPFDVPENWVWARLGDACDTVLGKMLDKVKNKGDLKPYLRNANVQWGKFELGDLLEMRFEEKETERNSLRNGDLVMCEGGEPGRCAIWHDEQADMRFQKALHRVRPRFGIDSHYVYYVFQLYSGTDYLHNFFTGSTIKHLPEQSLKTILLPLPPVADQKRIVAKIEELLPHIAEYGEAESRLTSLNEGFPAALKKSILQAAVQGKLVDQDPNDEPVDVPEFEGETPFDVPEGWKWTTLGDVCNYGECQSVESAAIEPEAWFLDLEDIEKETGRLLTKKRKHDVVSLSTKHRFTKGQVLYSKLRPYLNKVIIADEDGYCTSEILPLDFRQSAASGYAQVFLMSPLFVDYANACSYGTKMPRLGTKEGKNALIPLPPLAEQKRIVARVEKLLAAVEGGAVT